MSEKKVTWGNHEIQMVFLHRSPKKDIELIRGWLNSGYVLITLNEDKAYFERRITAVPDSTETKAE